MDDFPLAKHIRIKRAEQSRRKKTPNNNIKAIRLDTLAAQADSKRLDFLERHLPKVNLQVLLQEHDGQNLRQLIDQAMASIGGDSAGGAA